MRMLCPLSFYKVQKKAIQSQKKKGISNELIKIVKDENDREIFSLRQLPAYSKRLLKGNK